MGDIALAWSLDAGAADLVLEDDDLASDAGLRTAVLLSLFLDRRAEDEDALPGEDDDRRGWWADEFAETDGDRIGSRLWLIDRAKRAGDVPARATELVREALAWLIEDRVASSIDVDISATGPALILVITIHRPQGDAVSFRFAHAWDGEAALAV